MAGKFIKGALVEFMPTFLVPLPNVIVFQMNPETIRHSWTPPQPIAAGGTSKSNPLAVSGMPGESFSFSLSMDVTDQAVIDSAVGGKLAQVSGVYSRLAALEMLMYPTGAFDGGLLGSVSISVSAGGLSASAGGSAGVTRSIPRSEVPTVLFVWGPGRIVPVRVTGLTITEKLYDAFLNPTHADAQIELKVLTPEELAASTDLLAGVARGAYAYSQGLRQALAVANLANAAESIIGMLPI